MRSGNNNRRTRTHCRALALAVAIAAALPAYAVSAQSATTREATTTFDIPAGDLSAALERFSTQSGIQAMYRQELVAGKRAKAVSGALAPAAALARLLDGTGLVLERVNDRTYVVKAAPAPAKSERKTSAKPKTSGVGNHRAEDSAIRNLDDVVVVGSRMGGSPMESAAPIKVITREDIERSGAGSVSQMLSYMSEVSVNGNFNGSIGAVGAGTGLTGRDINAATVQLRGLPLGTTLVLINGRRSGESSALMKSGQFDLNTIPLAMVERIEVLPAGASAVYGGDGMAGVVNIVLRRDADGIGVRMRHSQADGYAEQQASVLLGKSWSRGSATVTLSGEKGNGLESAQRSLTADQDYTRFGGRDLTGTMVVFPGNVYSLDGCPPAPARCGVPLAQRGNLPGLDSPFAMIPVGQDGRSPSVDDFRANAGKLNRGSANAQLISPMTSKSLAFNGNFELTPSVEVFGELMYNRRSIPARMMELQVIGGEYGTQSAVVGADNPFNPFGVAVGVDYWYRNTGIYRHFEQTYWRGMFGARGELGDWRWEASAWRSRDKSSTGDVGAFVSSLFVVALNSSDPATALNPFAGDGNAPASQAVLRSFLSPYADGSGVATTGGNVYAHGPLLALPSGPVQALLGAEIQEHRLTSLAMTYSSIDEKWRPSENEQGDNRSKALFAELRVPLIAGSDEGHKLLTATGAFRWEDTGRIEEYASTETIGLEFRPAASLLVRGMYSTAFKPLPVYSAIRSHTTAGNVGVTDPTRGGQRFTVALTQGGGVPAHLRPESSTTRTLGVVFNPLGDLSASLTLWSAQLKDMLASTSMAQFFLDNEKDLPGHVIRDPVSGIPVSVDMRQFNINRVEMDGADIAVDARWRSSAVGEFNAGLSASYTHKYEQQLAINGTFQDHLGVIRNGGWASRWKIVPRVEWFHRELSASLIGRYVSRYEDPLALRAGDRAGQKQSLGDFWMFDANIDLPLGRYLGLQGRGPFLGGMRLSLGGRNLFNRLPDFCNFCSAGYDASQYDIVGRTLYAEMRLGF